jgi:hypothetical protein
MESIDRMHETSLVVEEKIKDLKIYYWQITILFQKQRQVDKWNSNEHGQGYYKFYWCYEHDTQSWQR